VKPRVEALYVHVFSITQMKQFGSNPIFIDIKCSDKFYCEKEDMHVAVILRKIHGMVLIQTLDIYCIL